MNAKIWYKNYFLLCLTASFLLWQPVAFSADKKVKKTISYKTIEWTELMPSSDLEALSNPPEYLTEIEDGSPEDQITMSIFNDIPAAEDDRYQQALVSVNIKPEMNQQAIRLPGFIVPLDFDEQEVVTEFFLVPFFGACIHVPPPPPNQIIHVKYPEGFALRNLYDPFWFSGVLTTELIENDMATAAYALEVHSIEVYTES